MLWCTSPALRRRENRIRGHHAYLHQLRHDHRQLLSALTYLGQWWLLVVVTAAAGTYLVLRGRRGDAVIVGCGAAAVLVAVLLGKLLLVRSNTNDRFGLTLSGFPSGHTADATALVGLCVLLIPRRARVWVALPSAALLGAAVGWSRIEIGAHTLAEVVGGWLLGLIVLCLAGARRVRSA